ncbi:MAG: toxin-antitoxin system protein [Thermodesulfobacteriota bacterium]|nr:toxin-antitoxin system protein [Thermodesulfobacteriota bacterium]
MPSANVRISRDAHAVLRQLAHQEGVSLQALLDRAVENYRRRLFLEKANAAYAALREDKAQWNEELSERGEWDATLQDGLNESGDEK